MRSLSLPFAVFGGHTRKISAARHTPIVAEYALVFGVLGVMGLVGWFLPVSYRHLGHVCFLIVLLLCISVSRGPALCAAIMGAVAWNFVFVPPRLAFAPLVPEDSLLLSVYLVAALIGIRLSTRIRDQQRTEALLRQRATALVHLTNALAMTRHLDDAVVIALDQANETFGVASALWVQGAGDLVLHPASTLRPDATLRSAAAQVAIDRRSPARPETTPHGATSLHVPLIHGGDCLGVFTVLFPPELPHPPGWQRELIHGFAAQIAQLLERDRLRAASEREKLLAESARLQRTLLDSVSHELKTPLAVLRSATEQLGAADPLRQRALLDEIRTATQRLDRLVANLLNQTRLETGPLTVHLDWCDVRDLIGSARQSLGELLAGRPFRLAIGPDVPLLRADPALMEHVLGNLLLNVVRHTPPGSSIEVSAGRTDADSRVFIAVADQGPGIPTESRPHLFQKFRRGRDAVPGGLGLGLSIVRGFMLAQGGEVTAEENPGGGARFVLSLPHASHELVPQE